MDAANGRIVASLLITREVDDGSQVGALLDRIEGSLASLTGDGTYDGQGVTDGIGFRYPDSVIIVLPRSTAVPSAMIETAPTQRDRNFQAIAEHGRMAWQAASGYIKRARAEAAMSRLKRVIGDGLRPRVDQRRVAEAEVAVHVLNRMLDLGRPTPSASPETSSGRGHRVHHAGPCNNAGQLLRALQSNRIDDPGHPNLRQHATLRIKIRSCRPLPNPDMSFAIDKLERRPCR